MSLEGRPFGPVREGGNGHYTFSSPFQWLVLKPFPVIVGPPYDPAGWRQQGGSLAASASSDSSSLLLQLEGAMSPWRRGRKVMSSRTQKRTALMDSEVLWSILTRIRQGLTDPSRKTH